jgi:tRNA dimethylallyltransferase
VPLDVFFLTGPTACGKSEVGLILAERTGAEIISLDSMKVYRRMDIGTAKPGPEARRRVPHHLIDIREPWEGYTVREYLSDADRAAAEVAARGRRVLFEGGTPLYLKAFLEGLFEAAPPDEGLRERLRAEAREKGLAHLHARLAAVDPAAAGRIHPNDERRIVRALEVHGTTGVPISDLQKNWGERRAHLRARLVALTRPRDELRSRIVARIDRQLSAGWVEEAKALLGLGRPLSRQAKGALGYRELWRHVRGDVTLEEARRRITRETWRFVRRQLTWLRSFGDLVWVGASDDPALDAAAVERAWEGA